MKTSEFYKKIEELGFELALQLINSWDERDIYVCKNKHEVGYFVKLGLRDDYIFLNSTLKDLDKELRDELVTTCMDYAFTPIEERKEEKKYYWKIKNENFEFFGNTYLNVHSPTWHIGTKGNYGDTYKTQLTEREYKQMVEDDFIPDIFEKEEI